MASATDLLSTPFLSGRASPEALLELPLTPIALDEGDRTSSEKSEERLSESPSPCARKAARRVARRVKKPARQTPKNQTIQEFIRRNESSDFTALLRGLADSSPDENRNPPDSSVGQVCRPAGAIQGRPGPDQPDDTNNEQEYEQQALETHEPDASASPQAPSEDQPPSPRFTPNRHTTREIFLAMKDVLTKSYTDSPGHAYILFDRLGASPFFKIGKSSNPRHRRETHLRKCQLRTWDSREKPATPIRMPMRLERLVQTELQNLNCDPRCPCGVDHVEYFCGEKEVGLEALDFWSAWLQRHEPYDRDGRLKGFWADRLEQFQGHVRDYFRCKSSQCAEQDDGTPACQACLRAGWKKWTEPMPDDELAYTCRTIIPWKCVQRMIQGISRLGPADNFYLIAVVHFIGRVLSAWAWISDPSVFLCAVPLRFLGFWVEPRIRLPAAFGWLLSVVDATLFVVCVYARVQQGRRLATDGKRSHRKAKRAKGVSNECRSNAGEVRSPELDEVDVDTSF
ncbi:hypothetical protein BDW62DRAFT_139001 [Aspergillus aurantiobrunneus]